MAVPKNLENKVARNKRFDGIFAVIGLLATLVGMLTLAALLLDLATAGLLGLYRIFSPLFRPGFRLRPASYQRG